MVEFASLVRLRNEACGVTQTSILTQAALVQCSGLRTTVPANNNMRYEQWTSTSSLATQSISASSALRMYLQLELITPDALHHTGYIYVSSQRTRCNTCSCEVIREL
jgi:hypothetical protein